jgi:hypothetical protein
MPFSGHGPVLRSSQLVAFTDGPAKRRNLLTHRVFEELPLGDGQNVSWAVPAGSDLDEGKAREVFFIKCKHSRTRTPANGRK